MDLPVTTKDITVDWLNEILHGNDFLGDSNIVSVESEQIGVGEGFMSDIARLSIKYDSANNDLPKCIVVKLPTSFPSAREAGMKGGGYEREIRFYTEVASKSPLRTPEVVYTHIDKEQQQYILMMKDYSHCKKPDMSEGADEELAKIIINKLADFHARWWDANDLYSFPWIPRMDTSTKASVVENYQSIINECVNTSGFESIFPQGTDEICRKIKEHLDWLVNIRNDNLTLQHSDFRIGNIFIDFDTPDDPLVFYDWSGIRIGIGVCDLSYFLGWSLTTTTRRIVESELLRIYWEAISKQITTEYSHDEFLLDYLRGLLVMTFIPLFSFSRLDLSSLGGKESEKVKEAMHRWFITLIDNNAVSVLPS